MGQVSEGGRVGEEESRDAGAEPQIDGRKRCGMSRAGEKVSGGVRKGVAVTTDVGGRFANAVKERVQELAKVRAELS